MSAAIRVLVVEDSEDDARLVIRTLRQGGFDLQFERVGNAQAMRDALARKGWDAVIADFRMPGFTGMDALEILKASGLDIPFILVSGAIGEETAVAAMKAGASDYVMKENLSRLAPALQRELREGATRAQYRKAQCERLESEERYRDLVESSRDLICTHDLEGNLLSVNEGAERLSGYSRDALLHMNLADLLAPAARASFPAYLAEIQNRGVSTGLMRVQTAGGELRWWEYHNTLRTTGAAGPIVRGMSQDVSERMRAEKELRESEARFRALTEMSSDFYWESDAAHRLTKRASANRKVSTVSAFEQGAQIGQRRWEVPYLSPDEAGWQAHRAALDAHLPFRDFVLSRRGADGTERRIAISGDPVLDAMGAFKGYRGVGTDITARNRADEALRESEARFRSLTLLSSDWYWEQDAEYRFASFAGGDEYGGWGPDQSRTLGLRRWELVGVIPLSGTWNEHKALLEARQPFRNFEYQRFVGDGTVQHIAASGEPVFDGNGRFTGYRGVATDITARKRAEADLRKLALAVRQSGSGILITDASGAIEFVNPKFEAMTGYCASEILGKNPRFLKSGLQSQEFYRDLWQTITGGEQWQGEIQNRKKTGERYWESQRISPVLGESGRIEHFIAIKEDISERRRAEKALRESEGKLRAIFENAIEGIFLVDAEGRVVSANPMLARMLGYESAEQMGKDIRSVAREVYVEKGARGRYLELLNASGSVEDFETQWRRKDGSIFWVSLSGRLMENQAGGKVHHLGMARDITERRQAQEKIRGLTRVYAVLSSINALIVRASDRKELFREVCRIALDLGGFPIAWIGEVDRDAMQVKPVAWHGTEEGFLGQLRMTIREDAPEGIGAVGRAVRDRAPVISNDIEHDPQVPAKGSMAQGARSLVVLPIVVGDAVAAVLNLYSGVVGFFDEKEMKLLTELAGDIGFALDHIEKTRKLDYLAYYDSLTGLANRTLLRERLSQYVRAAQQNEGKLALVLADVERLKMVNDSLGRQAGDELLKQLAARLGRATDPACVARVAGDHFAIVLPQIKGRSEVGRTIERMWRECFTQPFSLGKGELRVSAKAGIAVFPNDGADAEALLANAETALEEAQQTGERTRFHSRDLTDGLAERFALGNQLRQGLEKDQFVLHYQPKQDLETGRIAGVEALIRWQSPELGLVAPEKFIPLMERSGLILEVGAWALQKAIEDHLRWQQQGLAAPRVAVNLSAVQLRRRDFLATLREALKCGATPPGIDLEVTEDLVIEDIEDVLEKLKAVRDLGVSIAIDHFGTGYSSLGNLARLPVQSLKIDRSFIITMLSDPDAMTLVQTIITLAQSLRLKAVAEGVDTEEQAKFLRLLRCDEIQGYLFSKPLSFDEMTALLQKEVRSVEGPYA